MGRTTRHGPKSRGVSLAQRVLWALVVLALVVAPAFDVAASVHSRPGYGSGARCPLHANPGLTAEAVAAMPAFVGQALALVEPLVRLAPVPSPIFIPPRP